MPYGEVWDLYVNPNTNRFGLLHRYNQSHTWTDLEGNTHTNTVHDPTYTRLYAHTSSLSYTSFPASATIFAPDAQDSGETQFYNMSNTLKRGEYLISMLSVLRDDLKASGTPDTVYDPYLDANLPVYGIGYTVLAWSSDDGLTWQRDRHTNTFFDPDPTPGTWDHAHAWIDSIVPVGDEVYYYYGGYKYGHKNYIDRQIGLVKAKKDRYVRQLAGATTGKITTKTVTYIGNSLYLNAAVDSGSVQVRLLSPTGGVLSTCSPVSNIDAVSVPVTCNPSLDNFRNQPAKFEFSVTQGSLFAFSLSNAGDIEPTGGDGDVDINDFFRLLSAFGSTNCGDNILGPPCLIDVFDFNLLVKNFGKY